MRWFCFFLLFFAVFGVGVGVGYVGFGRGEDKLPELQREIFEAVDKIDVALAKWKSSLRNQNRCVKLERLPSFLSSINSYTGIMKTRNGYAMLRNLIDHVDRRWLEWCEFDKQKSCLVARNGYRTNQLLAKKYNLEYKCYDTARKKRAAKQAA